MEIYDDFNEILPSVLHFWSFIIDQWSQHLLDYFQFQPSIDSSVTSDIGIGKKCVTLFI